MDTEKDDQKRKVTWKTALIVSILVGWLGADRFLLGQTGLGFLKLFTLGFGGMWWLIDLALIACKYQFKNVEWI